MNPAPGRYPSAELPNLALKRAYDYHAWKVAAVITFGWCVILLGIVGWLVYRGSL